MRLRVFVTEPQTEQVRRTGLRVNVESSNSAGQSQRYKRPCLPLSSSKGTVYKLFNWPATGAV